MLQLLVLVLVLVLLLVLGLELAMILVLHGETLSTIAADPTGAEAFVWASCVSQYFRKALHRRLHIIGSYNW